MEPKDVYDPTMVAMDDALHAYHRESGLAAIPFSAQAGGWFQKHSQPDATARGKSPYDSPVNLARLERARKLAVESGLTMTQTVLGYLTGQSFATVPIVGCKNQAQLADSLTTGDVRLSPDQIRFLEK